MTTVTESAVCACCGCTVNVAVTVGVDVTSSAKRQNVKSKTTKGERRAS